MSEPEAPSVSAVAPQDYQFVRDFLRKEIGYDLGDDRQYLAHSVAYRAEKGSPRIEYLPVKITRWPPGQRVFKALEFLRTFHCCCLLAGLPYRVPSRVTS